MLYLFNDGIATLIFFNYFAQFLLPHVFIYSIINFIQIDSKMSQSLEFVAKFFLIKLFHFVYWDHI